jgi:hypothetical protein
MSDEWMAAAEQNQDRIVWHHFLSGVTVAVDRASPPLADRWFYAHAGDHIERRCTDPYDRRWLRWQRAQQPPASTVFPGEQLPPPPPQLIPPPPPARRRRWSRRRAHGRIER